MSTSRRLYVVAACLLGTAVYLSAVSRAEPMQTRESLATCPVNINDWRGQAAPPLDARTLEVLGVDEYLNRVYVAADGKPVGLYIAYYGSQRTGDTMHSPLNCLPGAGWMPVRFDRVTIPVATDGEDSRERPIEINRYVVEKGLDRQVVLYWYQSQGRVVASEYWGKIYLVLDAIRTNRTDGSLVRLVSPVITTEEDAENRAIDFARALYPLLARYLPS